MKRTKKEILKHVVEPIESSKIVANNTIRINYENGTTAIRFHDTDIVTIAETDGRLRTYTLNSGGWRTRTTKERMEQFSPARITSSNGIWRIRGGEYFYDGCIINELGDLISPPKTVDVKAIEKMKLRIKKFASLITKENLPMPSSGDCWYCLMRTESGETLGDASKNHEHLNEHMKDKYLHGSILVNAMKEYGYRDEGIGLHYQMKLADTFRRAVRRYMQKRLIPNIQIR